MLLVVMLFILMIVVACGNNVEESQELTEEQTQETEQKEVAQEHLVNFGTHDFYQPISGNSITHIHGMGYPNNQAALFVATHHGLRVYQDGQWYETVENSHDFMGFQATATGMFMSGHPEPGSDLLDPLGLLRSDNFGETLEQLRFYGESDFHYMAVSYVSGRVYVINEFPNSELGVGLFYSNDFGETWTGSKLQGLPPVSAHSFAAHPKLGKIIGITTPEGLYLSHNSGNSFSLISESLPTSALFFKNGSILYVVEQEGRHQLVEQSLESDATEQIELPDIGQDSILYLAVNPQNRDEISFVTLKSSVWMTQDNGNNWINLIKEGTVQ